MTPEERAALAAQMLDNPVWDESFAILKDAYTSKLMLLGPEHDLERYKFCEALRQIDIVKAQIERTFEIGKAMADEIAAATPENVVQLPNYALKEGVTN